MSTQQPNAIPQDRAEIIDLLKKAAKALKKERAELQLSAVLDEIAVRFGFPNWSLLHKNVIAMTSQQFMQFSQHVMGDPRMQPALLAQQPFIDLAREEMREWVHANYTPLIEFAYYDNEAENGFSLPSEDISTLLQEEFDHRFPFDLIEQVALDLEMDGPWGDEKHWLGGDDDEAAIEAS